MAQTYSGWASASDYAEDLRIDKNILIQHTEFIEKLEILLDLYLKLKR